MIAYVDSSVLLRKVLRQPGALREWAAIQTGVASALVETECLRTLDRVRLRMGLPDKELARRREAVFRLLESIEVVEVTAPVLARAAHPLPTELGTLDAIHLATALLWREQSGGDIIMATHDAALGTAARSCGLAVVGDSA
ncbi:MAG: type II toxin-antitoxin system VapC family toxin [Candidatus Rokubacteria bacterium]|nr:type II toxin-antitoxin system VapC family toxin [Candidatus Rokubacteria bacterium]MBI3826114.1 type II toxin-antitoxin system VapC family toxin [Candidatus Rokubacteria bacterium]